MSDCKHTNRVYSDFPVKLLGPTWCWRYICADCGALGRTRVDGDDRPAQGPVSGSRFNKLYRALRK